MKKENIVYGKHVVSTLLANYPHLILELHAINPELRVTKIKNQLKVKTLTSEKIKALMLDQVNHQGVVAIVSNFPYLPWSQLLTKLKTRDKDLILMLDKVQDPQNFGAIIRSAALLGVKDVIISEYRQTLMTPAAIKASVGAAYLLNITIVSNLNHAVAQLKKKGYWIYSSNLNQQAIDMRKIEYATKSVLIVGNEHHGVSQLLTRNSDVNLFIPTVKIIDSLNVGTATALLLFQISSQLGII